jgi:hypothetical protein
MIEAQNMELLGKENGEPKWLGLQAAAVSQLALDKRGISVGAATGMLGFSTLFATPSTLMVDSLPRISKKT